MVSEALTSVGFLIGVVSLVIFVVGMVILFLSWKKGRGRIVDFKSKKI